MEVQQFVMAYGAEQDRLRALLPDGFTSLRPVLRINAEIRDGGRGYVEFVTAAGGPDGHRGWIMIENWEDAAFETDGRVTTFRTEHLEITFTGTGIAGGCPAERDNDGCYVCENGGVTLRPAETITAHKEFCDCSFRWRFGEMGNGGVSIGKTLPAIPTAANTVYPRRPLTTENAAAIPCTQVLGAYRVTFVR